MKTVTVKTGRKIVFRPLKKTDLKALYTWVKIIEKEDTFILLNPHEPVSYKEEKEFFKNNLKAAKAKKKILMVAFDGNQHIGNCSVEKLGKRQGHIGRFGIALLKTYRSQGIGRQLAEYTINRARRRLGIRQIVLNCLVNNKVGLALYKKLGFKKYGIHPRAVLYKGKLMDEILFYKELE